MRWTGSTSAGCTSPSGHPVHAEVTIIDGKGQHQRARRFYVRLGNGTRQITDEAEIERYVAQRWGRGSVAAER